MPELVAIDTIRFPLRDSDMLVGRRSADGTVTPDIDLGALAGGRTVSRRAAHVYRRGSQWRFKVDPAAQSVTTVGSQPLRADQEVGLQDGDRIKVGAISLVFQDGAQDGASANLELLSRAEPTAELRAEGWKFPLGAPLGHVLAVGRRSRDLSYRPDVDLRDRAGGTTVSRQHGELRRNERGWVLRVLGDVTNPTYMNRQLLAPGRSAAHRW
jgi:pSer/pThr/pTyr-binding forkhead associated (FHA) protein